MTMATNALLTRPHRVLVTEHGGGFIGSHLVDEPLAAGHEVQVLNNFATGDRRNLTHVRRDVSIIEGDIRSHERVHADLRGREIVFHQAALPSVPRSIQETRTRLVAAALLLVAAT